MAIKKRGSQRATPKCADERHAEGPHEIHAMPPRQKHAVVRPRNDRDHLDSQAGTKGSQGWRLRLKRGEVRPSARLPAPRNDGRRIRSFIRDGIARKDRTDALEWSKVRIQDGSAIKHQQRQLAVLPILSRTAIPNAQGVAASDPSSLNLKNRMNEPRQIILIGGSHGIGLGIVERCLAVGQSVTVFSRSKGSLEGLDGVQHVPHDVTKEELPADQLPSRIDGLVYCPGSINLGPLRGIKSEQLRSDFELNVVGAVKSIQIALPALKRSTSASVVLFSTVAVGTGLPMHTSVAASKGAIEALARTWAAELSPKIRVNAVAPALTDTPLAERFLDQEEKRKAMAEKYPLKRIGSIDDCAAAASFLLSPESGWITGQVIGVDGGMSCIVK